jgi:Family of unknown function (DUF6069)
MSTTTTSRLSPAAGRSTQLSRAAVVAGAAAAALAFWVVSVPVLGTEVAVHAGADAVRSVSGGAVLVTSLVAGLAGWGVLAMFERRLAAPRRAWTVTALGVLVLSLTGPVTQGASGTSVLVCLHLVVGLVLIPALARTVRC